MLFITNKQSGEGRDKITNKRRIGEQHTIRIANGSSHPRSKEMQADVLYQQFKQCSVIFLAPQSNIQILQKASISSIEPLKSEIALLRRRRGPRHLIDAVTKRRKKASRRRPKEKFEA